MSPARQPMQDKANFWLGMALCVGAVLVAVASGDHWDGHLSGMVLFAGGLVLAVRHARH